MSEPLPRWPALVGVVSSVLGLGVAGYLTFEHFTSSSTLACSDTGVINCLKVTTSTYSEVGGIPVALLGLAYFGVMLVMQLPTFWERSSPSLRVARVTYSIVGLGTVLYLVIAELFVIDAICMWCTAVHFLTLGIFVTTVYATVTYQFPALPEN